MSYKGTDFQEHLKEQLKDPEFKRGYEEFGKQLEISYKIMQLRKKSGMTQLEFAKKIGTTQGNVARMEAGNQNFTTQILTRIAEALNKDLKVDFV